MSGRVEQLTSVERGKRRAGRPVRRSGGSALSPLYPLATLALLATASGCSAAGDTHSSATTEDSPDRYEHGVNGGIGPDYGIAPVVDQEPHVTEPTEYGAGGMGGAGGAYAQSPVSDDEAMAHSPDCHCQFAVK